MISPEAFAAALVARLARILPPGFEARAEGDLVAIDAPDGPGASTSVGHLDPGEAGPEDYADAAWNVLSLAQDVVSETVAEPWPAAAGRGFDLAEPGARADGTRVVLYFGEEANPVLTLPPIDLGNAGS